MIHQSTLVIETAGRGLTDITGRVREVVADAQVTGGLCTVFCHHTSASLLINEGADPSVRRDLEAWLSRLVKDGDPLFTHTDEGHDDMSAHVRTALTQTSLSVPLAAGTLDLGTWQALYLWEHRERPHARRVSVVVIG
jgi:secondary thiamine-phosphate synthase enzyme